ncbi:hypothetical protein AALO_G00009510 [Alosa alosa]|uniref:Uncharacterized protein n=1 Tax=Alosa alosa TaxID=278164 RepID=A0AAV6HIR8_9TELE|nr:hypothetical protein AALO_G00009510 [Alosa alosa]
MNWGKHPSLSTNNNLYHRLPLNTSTIINIRAHDNISSTISFNITVYDTISILIISNHNNTGFIISLYLCLPYTCSYISNICFRSHHIPRTINTKSHIISTNANLYHRLLLNTSTIINISTHDNITSTISFNITVYDTISILIISNHNNTGFISLYLCLLYTCSYNLNISFRSHNIPNNLNTKCHINIRNARNKCHNTDIHKCNHNNTGFTISLCLCFLYTCSYISNICFRSHHIPRTINTKSHIIISTNANLYHRLLLNTSTIINISTHDNITSTISFNITVYDTISILIISNHNNTGFISLYLCLLYTCSYNLNISFRSHNIPNNLNTKCYINISNARNKCHNTDIHKCNHNNTGFTISLCLCFLYTCSYISNICFRSHHIPSTINTKSHIISTNDNLYHRLLLNTSTIINISTHDNITSTISFNITVYDTISILIISNHNNTGFISLYLCLLYTCSYNLNISFRSHNIPNNLNTKCYINISNARNKCHNTDIHKCSLITVGKRVFSRVIFNIKINFIQNPNPRINISLYNRLALNTSTIINISAHHNITSTISFNITVYDTISFLIISNHNNTGFTISLCLCFLYTCSYISIICFRSHHIPRTINTKSHIISTNDNLYHRLLLNTSTIINISTHDNITSTISFNITVYDTISILIISNHNNTGFISLYLCLLYTCSYNLNISFRSHNIPNNLNTKCYINISNARNKCHNTDIHKCNHNNTGFTISLCLCFLYTCSYISNICFRSHHIPRTINTKSHIISTNANLYHRLLLNTSTIININTHDNITSTISFNITVYDTISILIISNHKNTGFIISLYLCLLYTCSYNLNIYFRSHNIPNNLKTKCHINIRNARNKCHNTDIHKCNHNNTGFTISLCLCFLYTCSYISNICFRSHHIPRTINTKSHIISTNDNLYHRLLLNTSTIINISTHDNITSTISFNITVYDTISILIITTSPTSASEATTSPLPSTPNPHIISTNDNLYHRLLLNTSTIINISTHDNITSTISFNITVYDTISILIISNHNNTGFISLYLCLLYTCSYNLNISFRSHNIPNNLNTKCYINISNARNKCHNTDIHKCTIINISAHHNITSTISFNITVYDTISFLIISNHNNTGFTISLCLCFLYTCSYISNICFRSHHIPRTINTKSHIISTNDNLYHRLLLNTSTIINISTHDNITSNSNEQNQLLP